MNKFLLTLFLFGFLTFFAVSADAQNITSAEVQASPDVLTAGVINEVVYLQGLNTQLFSFSSSKEPTIEAAQHITINNFQILSPKLALMNVNVSEDAFGSLQFNLKFYDTDGKEVLKSCVFFINVLGPKTESGFTYELTSIPEIQIDSNRAQATGSIEITGTLKGAFIVKPPKGTKFFADLTPSVTSLTLNASVTNIEVSSNGDILTFFVENASSAFVKVFISNIFLDTSEFTRNNGVRGQLSIEISGSSLPSNVFIPVARTYGWTSSSNVISNDNKPNNDENNNTTNPTRENTGSGTTFNNSGNASSSNRTSQEGSSDARNTGRTPRIYSQQGSSYNRQIGYDQRGFSNQPNNTQLERSSMGVGGGSAPERESSSPSFGTRSRRTKEEDKKPALSFPKYIEINPDRKSKYGIINVSFCNPKFVRYNAIPLEISDDGFKVKFNLEIEYVNNEGENEEQLTLVISLPGIDDMKVILNKHKDNIYRSNEIINIVLPFSQFN